MNNELDELMNELVNKLVKENGLEGVNKEKIANQMKEKIQEWELTPQDMADNKVQDVLCVAIINLAVADKFPQHQFNFDIKDFDCLFEKNPAIETIPNTNAIGIKDKLTETLLKFLGLANQMQEDPQVKNKLQPKPTLENKNEKDLEELAEDLAKEFKEREDQRLIDTPAVSAALRGLLILFGMDPRIEGGFTSEIHANPGGNGLAFSDANGDNPNAVDNITRSSSKRQKNFSELADEEERPQEKPQANTQEADGARKIAEIFESIGTAMAAPASDQEKPYKSPTPFQNTPKPR